ncbi:hypothetical protein [Streptomyces sp. VRA16 Mangrove soil]|uniref:hypothetical protein n=1 Tax=Streptomyces sp. VRA16 Mangrove soil TaxID=2817434 RepID=UPI001A9F5B41|nr:hypothetical protein [Streptomyces sp. VRA16 Mangrove soil]MBO1336675.1 hypothetical protein [Streptomyces sp. VRA16 Mangrove soil]
MEERHRIRPVTAALVPAATALAAWALWLGWDQHRDVHPDGSTTGPYAAWQVIGLVVTVLIPVYWSASRHHPGPATLGTTAALTAAAAYDWSDDASGLFMVGVVMVLLGTWAATATLTTLISRTSHHAGTA